jgi:hypothetical protein
MEPKQASKPLDSKSKAPSYRRKDTSILPLPTFITREISESLSSTKPSDPTCAGRAPLREPETPSQ